MTWRRAASVAAFAMIAVAGRAGASVDGGESAPAFSWQGAWPLFERDGEATRWFGPFVETWSGPAESGFAVRPVYSRHRIEAGDRSGWDVLYPLLTGRRTAGISRSQFLQLLRRRVDRTSGDAQPDDRVAMLFPFYFMRRSADPARSYTALFPVGGTIRSRWGRDEIFFCLFPLHSRTVRRGVTTWNWLWPIFSRSQGPDTSGWGVFPFYGTLRSGAERNAYLLWPFVTWRDDAKGRSIHAVLPFYVANRQPGASTTAVLWPFFYLRTRDDPAYRERGILWPFGMYGAGEEERRARIWPLFSVEQAPDRRRGSLGWLIWREKSTIMPLGERSMRRFFYVLATDRVSPTSGGEARRISTVFPFLVWERTAEGATEWQVPAPFSSLVPGLAGVRRNFKPLFRVVHGARTADGAKEFDLLWRFWRWRRTPGSVEWGVAGSLVQRVRVDTPDGPRTRWRLLWGAIDTGRAADRLRGDLQSE